MNLYINEYDCEPQIQQSAKGKWSFGSLGAGTHLKLLEKCSH